jgi:hypothetical protein
MFSGFSSERSPLPDRSQTVQLAFTDYQVSSLPTHWNAALGVIIFVHLRFKKNRWNYIKIDFVHE